MKIREAIDLVDRMKPNAFDRELKVYWLAKLDGHVFNEILKTHKGCPLEEFHGYDGSSSDTELLVPAPYAEDVYNYFLQAQIDKENGETAKYNQSITMYNNAYKTFGDWYNRTHRPLPCRSAWRF